MELLEKWHVAAFDRAKVIVIHEGPGPDGRTYKDGLHQHTICICNNEEGKAAEYGKFIAAAPETARKLAEAEARIAKMETALRNLLDHPEDKLAYWATDAAGPTQVTYTPWHFRQALDTLK